MSNHEIPSDKNIEEMSESGIDMLSHYLAFYQPTLESTEEKDLFLLAKQFQHGINQETNKNFQVMMGFAGRDQLNDAVPDRLLTRRLAIVTNRLFALGDAGIESGNAEDYDKPVLVSGMFEHFNFMETDDQKLISAEFIMPKFLRPRLDMQSPQFAEAKRVVVPVDAIGARIYDPETFFNN